MWPAPSWLESSVVRALHWHRRGHGFESRLSLLNSFRLSFCNCLSCVVNARILLLFDLSSAVQIYVRYICIYLFKVDGYITNSQCSQVPVGLKAQLLEHCTGIAEAMASNPVQAWIFLGFHFETVKLRSNCEDLYSIWSFIRGSNICFIYLLLFIHLSRVYYELTMWPAPSWHKTSVGRALHRHCRGHGFEYRSSLTFFSGFLFKTA